MKLQVIVGSTRQGRISDRLAKWVANEAAELPDTEAEVVDLKDYEMPFFDEPTAPQYNPDRKPAPTVQKWLDKLDEADAYVLVTPEYNRSYSAVLKNSLDYIGFQFKNKPIGLVAHGSTGGAQAIAHLRGVLAGLQTFTVPNATFFSDSVANHIDGDGNLSEEIKAKPYGPLRAVTNTLEQLKWYSDALETAREREEELVAA